MLLLSSADLFQINILKKSSRNTIGVKRFGSISVGPDLGSNCLQRLSGDDKT